MTRVAAQVWFRLVLFTVGAVAVVLVAWLAGPYLPMLGADLGQDSVGTILNIMATSMLAVTTFSLTAMISAYSAAAQGTTPRATQLLVEDPTSQNALSTFLGAFVFAIVGIIALGLDAFGEQARSVLFIATLVVIATVVVTLLRWIHHLTEFGRVPDIIDRVERAATTAACEYAKAPHLGGSVARDAPGPVTEFRAHSPGCVTGISMAQLERWARKADARVHVDVLPGVTVGKGTVLGRVEGRTEVSDADAHELRGAFLIEDHRTYEQDPRLGLVALSEIGSRALSPSTNDPGTAIEVLNALERVFIRVLTTRPDPEVPYPHVHVPQPRFEDLIEDAFRPVARDGAALVEIGLRVQRVLGHLIDVADPREAQQLVEASERGERRAVASLRDEGDRDLVRRAALAARERGPA
ncbi:DUF2254 domain-containing protein [Demequina globuliformis]|uniref:DUF2254 domain-containing protein n=1 Tax=Demequina globuliformis TaxID=676202 RepID=UPI00137924C5|nr:DUF2254 domain-containing protein [Demequina globuliformis]